MYADGATSAATHYALGGFVYERNSAGAPSLAYFSTSEGRAVREGGGWQHEYHLTDHLGNTRVAFTASASSNAATVVQETAYYPYGMQLAGLGSSESGNDYLYNGKELEDAHGLRWYHYGARFYDPAIAKWASMDPADQFHSPYSYVGGDPVNLVDPDGRQAASASGASKGTTYRSNWGIGLGLQAEGCAIVICFQVDVSAQFAPLTGNLAGTGSAGLGVGVGTENPYGQMLDAMKRPVGGFAGGSLSFVRDVHTNSFGEVMPRESISAFGTPSGLGWTIGGDMIMEEGSLSHLFQGNGPAFAQGVERLGITVGIGGGAGGSYYPSGAGTMRSLGSTNIYDLLLPSLNDPLLPPTRNSPTPNEN